MGGPDCGATAPIRSRVLIKATVTVRSEDFMSIHTALIFLLSGQSPTARYGLRIRPIGMSLIVSSARMSQVLDWNITLSPPFHSEISRSL